MNDDWVEQKCYKCKFYKDCDSIHVLAPNKFQLFDSKTYRLDMICGICKIIIESPKILYYDPKTKKDS